jgi:hypothetical protein
VENLIGAASEAISCVADLDELKREASDLSAKAVEVSEEERFACGPFLNLSVDYPGFSAQHCFP